jgi:hypothetical protein
MNSRQRFEAALQQHAADLIRIGEANPSRMDTVTANLRRLGGEYADMLAAVDERTMRQEMRRSFQSFTGGGYKREFPTVKAYRIERLSPVLRAELDRRIASAASLIKINRQNMINETIQRFVGWSTGDIAGQVTPPREVTRPDQQASDCTVRRVRIDQKQKLRANIADISANELGAIAFYWRGSHDDRERELHKDRNDKLYLIKDSWADKQALVNVRGAEGWNTFTRTKDDGMPGMPIFCRCHAEYVFNLDELPAAAVSVKGREFMENQKAR